MSGSNLRARAHPKDKGGKQTPPPSADAQRIITEDQVVAFERTAAHLSALHQEFAVQAKAKPDNPINTFKLRMLNEKLEAANSILVGEFQPFATFLSFVETDLPTNSDVALVLGTYLASLERWRSAHVRSAGMGTYCWRTGDGPHLTATSPTRFRPND